MVWYLDTSAFLKLVVEEDESTAMMQWFESHSSVWSSQLLRTEALLAAARLAVPVHLVEEALDAVALILPTEETFAKAGRLQPVGLRSLDAIHLAAALELGADLEGLVSYDDRLIDAAGGASVVVVSP